MSGATGHLLAIGIGNVLLRDDGAGVRVIERLSGLVAAGAVHVPPGTRMVDGGTLGLDLLRELEGARGVVFVDAGNRGEPPGRVTIHRGTDALGAVAAGGDDGEGIGQLLAAGRLLGVLPPAVAAVEIAAGEIAVGTGLSREVQVAMADAAEAVRRELVAMDGAARAIRDERQAMRLGAIA